MRLLSTCGLNTIETGNFLDYPRADPRRQPQVRRVGVAPFTSLGPPADPIELGERIWAFWTAFCTSISLTLSSQSAPSS